MRSKIELLAAIAEQQIHRHEIGNHSGFWALYMLGPVEADEEISYAELRRLANEELIDLPMIGPPTLTPIGKRVLRESGR